MMTNQSKQSKHPILQFFIELMSVRAGLHLQQYQKPKELKRA